MRNNQTSRGQPTSLCIRPDQKAFTLIEIMIVIAIMAIVMAISIPTMHRLAEKDSMRRVTHDLLDLFSYVRAKSILNGYPMQLTIYPQQRSFVTTPAGAGAQPGESSLEDELDQLLRGDESNDPMKSGRYQLHEDIGIEFIGINFVPDLQEAEQVATRFYPNGTCDEFVMVIRSRRNEWRMFKLDVATALVDWEVLR